jgi:hypothetical protein
MLVGGEEAEMENVHMKELAELRAELAGYSKKKKFGCDAHRELIRRLEARHDQLLARR